LKGKKHVKALILSDIHSNIYALEAIWAKENDSDLIFCAGDLVDYGPFPAQVIEWIRSHNTIVVQGNHDKRVAEFYRNGGLDQVDPNDTLWAHHNARRLDEDSIAYLEGLPLLHTFEMDGIAYTMSHQYDHAYGTIEFIVQFDKYWRIVENENLLNMKDHRSIFGHTHRRCVHRLGEHELWLNPGSASYRRPDDPSKEAHYITIQDGIIHLKSLAYDRSKLFAAIVDEPLMQMERLVAFFFFGSGFEKLSGN